MTVFQRFAVGVSSLVRSCTKLHETFSARQCSLLDNIPVFEKNKSFVRGFMAVPNRDTAEVDLNRLEGENHGRFFFYFYFFFYRVLDTSNISTSCRRVAPF